MISILLAEDNTHLGNAYKASLTNHFGKQLTIDIVKNGEEVVEKIKRGKKYDMLILDVDMPLLDGFKSAEAVRKLGFRKQIIAHTTIGFQETYDAMVAGLINGFSRKTSHGRNLVSIVKRMQA